MSGVDFSSGNLYSTGMAHLLLSALPKKHHPRIFREIADRQKGRTRESPIRVEAGGHVFTYTFREELRFGPPFYQLTVRGPFEDKFNRVFKGGDYFYSAYPFNPESGLYVFERAADVMRLRREISVYRLANGRKISSVEEDFLRPHLWRPCSEELILFSWTELLWEKWTVRSRRSDRIVDLYGQCNECHATADGRYLVFNESNIPFVSLYDFEAGEVVHTLTKKDFKKLTPEPRSLEFFDFDAGSRELTFLINYSYGRYRKPRMACDVAVSVQVVD